MTARPMVRIGQLGPSTARRILDRARTAQPSYGFAGALLGDDPPPLDLVAERVVGRGPDAFACAVAHLRSFGPQRAIATVWPDDARVALGADLIVAIALGPITVVALDRVVAVVDEPDRWGFAYGTLPGHIEEGEEAFVVERRPDGTVVARITARAHTTLPAAGVLQHVLVPIQRRYAERYLDAVSRAVTGRA